MTSARILHVAESAMGGVGTYLNQVVALQARTAGLSVMVVVPDEHAGQMPDIAPVIAPFRRRGRTPRSLAALALAVLTAARRFRPEVIHAHSTFAGAVVRGLRAFGLVRCRVVYCPHCWALSMNGGPLLQRAAAAIEKALFRYTDIAVMVSEGDLAVGRALGLPEKQLVLVRNGLAQEPPPAVAASWEGDGTKVLFIGRLDQQKGADILLEAARRLEDKVSVRMAGGTVTGGDVVKMSSSNVEFLGWLDAGGVQSHLLACDLVAIPSRWEGLPLVALEAMRAARMVVATTVGGIPEVVADGETGRLIPPGDADALSAALVRDGLEAREEMGRKARLRFLDAFTLDRVHAELIDVYAGLVRLKGARLLPRWRTEDRSSGE